MKKMTQVLAVMAVFAAVGIAPISSATAAGEDAAFMDALDKSMKISGQMASGKVPYNPAKAAKEMVNIQNAVVVFQAAGGASAPKAMVDCATLLKIASAKGEAAAKAGQGAFKAVYGDLLTGYKACTN